MRTKNTDYATVLREWKPLAEQGDAYVQFLLGSMYLEGLGVSQNDKAALEWLTRSADQGDDGAQFALGQMYRRGQGVPENDKTAVKWYTLAAEQGNALAQNGLGQMYDEGKGVPENVKITMKWWWSDLQIVVQSLLRDLAHSEP